MIKPKILQEFIEGQEHSKLWELEKVSEGRCLELAREKGKTREFSKWIKARTKNHEDRKM